VKFKLSDNFIEKYKKKKVPFGFNGLGEIVFLRTYSRIKENGENEQWYETVRRVVEGTYGMQKDWIDSHSLGWNAWKAQSSAQHMYDRIFSMKFLPPGRGLANMGTDVIEKKKLNMALNNCAYIGTENLKEDPTKPFCFVMDVSMLGTGCGSDVKGAGSILVKGPNANRNTETFQIPDSREGWVESLRLLLESYFHGTAPIIFDYSLIRPAGEPIKGFGGTSSGYKPLETLHEKVRLTLENNVGNLITETSIADIMNLIGVCVVSGNVRRTAIVLFGKENSEEYLDLKNYDKNPHRADYGWTSNNSIFAEIGMDYKDCCERTKANGEPGYIWLNNMQAYSRMKNGKDWKDHRAKGANPCCFHGDTLIAVADGRGAVSIKELTDIGNDFPVYSLNKDNKIEIKMARVPHKSRENAELIKITFDNGEELTVTPDHKIPLLNGEYKEAKNLREGDSLPRLNKKVSKLGKQKYLQVNCNVLDSKKDKVYEHKLIAKFNNKEKFNSIYNEEKKNGWIDGGVVIHHKDYNGLNNSPDNLEIMSFKEHARFHALRDNKGENNSMYGRKHNKETKALIGRKSKLNWKKQHTKMANSIKEGMSEEVRAVLSEKRKEINKKYYIEQEKQTDLPTVWINNRLYAIKVCETCGEHMIVTWRDRNTVFCSISCSNQSYKGMKARKEGQIAYFTNKQQELNHKRMGLYKGLRDKLRREPLLSEFSNLLKVNNISFRLNKNSNNPYIFSNYREFKEHAETYNHRVKSTEYLSKKEDVYNVTVEDNHTLGIVLSIDDDLQCDGVFARNCEQSLEDAEICCLVETFPNNHESFEDYKQTLKYAYLYAKTVTLGKTHWPDTNRVMLRNRRIGTSMSGIVQFITKHGIEVFRKWCEEGYKSIQAYDLEYSDWLAVPKSIKTTSVKPSGSVSLLAGATPGLHYPESRYYIRRVRLSNSSQLIPALKKANFKLEPAVGNEEHTSVVEIPVDCGEGIRSVKDVSMWEQLALAAFMQKHWADNQVSCTVTFDPEKEGDQIEYALNYYQYLLKGISFLPRLEGGSYKQMPYEAIDEKTYTELTKKLKPLNFNKVKGEEVEVEKFCDSSSCQL